MRTMSMDGDPFVEFGRWFESARAAGLHLPEGMALATTSAEGLPSVRMVLLKGYDPTGFVFYTNYQSRKAAELDASGVAALLLWWGVLERQIRIEGIVERVGGTESDAYFATRPRGSQIAAWASPQSSTIDRAELERRVAETEREFEGRPVERPPFWGGYRLIPLRIEFWQGRENRLHERWQYERESAGSGWRMSTLAP